LIPRLPLIEGIARIYNQLNLYKPLRQVYNGSLLKKLGEYLDFLTRLSLRVRRLKPVLTIIRKLKKLNMKTLTLFRKIKSASPKAEKRKNESIATAKGKPEDEVLHKAEPQVPETGLGSRLDSPSTASKVETLVINSNLDTSLVKVTVHNASLQGSGEGGVDNLL